MHAISSAKRHYYQNKVCHLKTNDPAGWHPQIKLLTQGRRDQPPITVPGVDCNGQFEHVANLINNNFISIAKDIPSIDRSLLPPYLPSPMPCPQVQPREVYKEIRSLKLTSLVFLVIYLYVYCVSLLMSCLFHKLTFLTLPLIRPKSLNNGNVLK